jgi:hypothetical protein
MTPFESDGVYAGIPYRVHPDTSIEAMMLGGLVKFKNMDQFLAAAAGTPNVAGALQSVNSYDGPANMIHQNANVPVSAKPLDYYSILLEAIHKAEQNSAQLRALVYERARFNFKRDALFGHSSMGLAELVRQVSDFELAVARIEANAADEQPRLSYQKQEARETALSSSSNAVEIMPPRPPTPVFEDLGPARRADNLKYGWPREVTRPYGVTAIQIIGSVLLGTICIAVIFMATVLWQSPKVSPKIEAAHEIPKTATASTNSSSGEDSTKPVDALPFPVPTSFGVYALTDNKLVQLEPLPLKVPDPRVALSAEITKPSPTTISANKPAFILFRRNLLNDAPDRLTLRVVARMVRETKIIGGKAVTTAIEQSWRIRNTSLEFKVSPIPGHSEMIIAREDDNLVLAPGRYGLVLGGVGYDFTIAGSATSTVHCLEQFESANGPLITECRAP